MAAACGLHLISPFWLGILCDVPLTPNRMTYGTVCRCKVKGRPKLVRYRRSVWIVGVLEAVQGMAHLLKISGARIAKFCPQSIQRVQ